MKIFNLYLDRYNEKKALLAFEFGIVLSDVASQLKIEMTQEIVIRAEKMLEKELRYNSPEEFACQMNVLVLAILEPKDI